MKIQEVKADVAITEKNEKTICQTNHAAKCTTAKVAFPDKITPDIDGFINETVFQCDFRVATFFNTFNSFVTILYIISNK